jgi:hypothetical protein
LASRLEMPHIDVVELSGHSVAPASGMGHDNDLAAFGER